MGQLAKCLFVFLQKSLHPSAHVQATNYNQARNAKHGTGQFLSMHILRDIYILQKNAYSGAHLIMQPSRKKNAQGLKNVQVQRAMKYEASLLNS